VVHGESGLLALIKTVQPLVEALKTISGLKLNG
jgi:hypothetical protein